MRRIGMIWLALLLMWAAPARAANFVSIADGNLTTSATWGTVDATGTLISTSTGTTALTTGNLDSTSFVLGVSQVGGFAVRLGSRATGSPSNTMTVTLRNSTTAANTCSVTANVSSLQATDTTADQGGWYYFKCASAFTPNGSDSYVIRATLSATSTAVSLSTNGTANNWQHITVLTATGAPTTGDDMVCAGQLDGSTNPATAGARAVTMNSTAATDYGSASTDQRIPALSVNNGCTFSSGTSASTTYILQLSGWLVVYSGGTLNIGTSGTPVPTTSTATLQFDITGATGDFGLSNKAGSTRHIFGSPRTSGKTVVWGLLTADMATSATSATWATDSGWLSGDTIVFASTSRTPSHNDVVTLNTNATSTTLAWTGGTTNAHKGSAADKAQAEIVLLTRNVLVQSLSSTKYAVNIMDDGSTIDDEWVAFRYFGASGTNRAYTVNHTSAGSVTLRYVAFRDIPNDGIYLTNNISAAVTISQVVFYNVASAGGNQGALTVVGTVGGSFSVDNLIVVLSGDRGIYLQARPTSAASFTNVHIAGASGHSAVHLPAGGTSSTLGDWSAITLQNFVIHSCNAIGVAVGSGAAFANLTLDTFTVWRNNDVGVNLNSGGLPAGNVILKNLTAFGNLTTNVVLNGIMGVSLSNPQIFGDTGFSTTNGLLSGGSGTGVAGILQARIEGGNFGTSNGGLYTTHTNDVKVSAGVFQIVLVGTTLSSGTPVSVTNNYAPGFIGRQNVSGVTSTIFPTGTIALDTGTTHLSGASEKLTPVSATVKLESGVRQYRVDSGMTVSPTVFVYKDGSYNGNQPRLVLKANPALGVAADTVLATYSASTGSWNQMTGTTPTASANGVFTFVVDVDGTAGNVFDAEWN